MDRKAITMKNEIERKFFVKKLPDLSGIVPLHYERYFLERGPETEIRISKINDSYKYEKKSRVSKLERTREKKDITEDHFNQLKKNASEGIIRDRYDISSDPDISIQIYHGRFEGLIRAEVEFETVEEAQNFIPPDWMGKEMSDLPIARDGKLIDLTDEIFKTFLQ